MDFWKFRDEAVAPENIKLEQKYLVAIKFYNAH